MSSKIVCDSCRKEVLLTTTGTCGAFCIACRKRICRICLGKSLDFETCPLCGTHRTFGIIGYKTIKLSAPFGETERGKHWNNIVNSLQSGGILYEGGSIHRDLLNELIEIYKGV